MNMCMKKFDAEKNVFCQTYWVSNIAIFLRLGIMVNSALFV